MYTDQYGPVHTVGTVYNLNGYFQGYITDRKFSDLAVVEVPAGYLNL